jgi:hypothetical protein
MRPESASRTRALADLGILDKHANDRSRPASAVTQNATARRVTATNATGRLRRPKNALWTPAGLPIYEKS